MNGICKDGIATNNTILTEANLYPVAGSHADGGFYWDIMQGSLQ